MTDGASEIAAESLELLRGWRDDFVGLLHALVAAESPSTVPEAQDGVRGELAASLVSVGLEVEHVPGFRTGGHLVGRAPREARAQQLLVGHMDTVWPIGTLREMPIEVDGDVFKGPGSFDMKAGLAIGIFALRALRERGVDPEVAPTFLISSDEEIGSPESKELILDLAKASVRALVLEPALGTEGRIKTRRKGVGAFTIEVHGKSAHGGLAPEEGASAILELASVIQRLQAIADPERGITVNVGVIEGGVRPNVVAANARAQVDVRVWTREDAERVEARVRALEPTVPGTRIEVKGYVGRAPLERTERNARLWESAYRIGGNLGLDLVEGSAGGGSDGNFTSAVTATLDGLGAVGDGAHAVHEFVFIDRALERAALLAGLLALPSAVADPER
ncbi:MAG: M20 family metallopeptidase [Gemmatimonadota bacterium]|nr:M20 family metallopeptidase [Gemmatimonadota bacterium]